MWKFIKRIAKAWFDSSAFSLMVNYTPPKEVQDRLLKAKQGEKK